MRLAGKTIIVTGSCTGIGAAMATRFVSEGANVVVHGLEESLGREIVKGLGSDKSIVVIADLTEESTPELLVSTALDKFGRLDAIVNNAAMILSSNIHTTSPEFFHKILETNLLAPFFLIQTAIPHLARTRGCVLNIGSVNAWSGEPELLAYSVSKGALQTLTRNLGDALNREFHIRVNQINPGWVLTSNESKKKTSEGFSPDWPSRLPKVYAPSGRILKPEEIAAAAVYWLSDEAGPVSGQVVDLEQYPFLGRNPPKGLGIF